MDPQWQPPAPGWQTPHPPSQPWPGRPSGLLKASGILMLVGAILSAAGAVLLLVVGLFFAAIFSGLEAEEGPFSFTSLIAGFYVVYGLVSGAGAACSFVAWGRISRLDLHGGFVWGLVGSLLPPLNILTLLGAIFAKTCPEAEAAAARGQQAGWSRPPQAR
jgi:hypothetical protein